MAPSYTTNAAERRRLQRLLNDEQYGPALVRLNKGQQRRILDLVSANQGKIARSEILRLDAERKQKVKERSKQRREAGGKRVTVRSWKQFYELLKKLDPVRQAGWESRLSVAKALRRHDKDFESEPVYSTISPQQAYDMISTVSPNEFFDSGSDDARRRMNWSPYWYHYYGGDG